MVVGGCHKERVRDTPENVAFINGKNMVVKTKRRRYIVIEGEGRGAVYKENSYSVIRTDNLNKDRAIKRLNSNKSFHTILTTGSIKKAKRVIKEKEVKNGTKHGL